VAAPTKQSRSLWRSKEAKRLYWVAGIPAAILLGWYAYFLAFEFNSQTVTRPEAILTKGYSGIRPALPSQEEYRAEEVDRCKNMIQEYTTPKGWFYADADIYELVGLPRESTREQLNARCIYYAKAVAGMERMAHHIRHAFVCRDSILDVSGNGRYYIKADPLGRGAIRNLDLSGEKLVEVPEGTTTVIKSWQVYNVGDGCIIVGLSKDSTFRMSGTIVRGGN
jgi:hypothetical protein